MQYAILIAVFGYAGWALYRSIRKSKEGKCAACSSKKTCCSDLPDDPK